MLFIYFRTVQGKGHIFLMAASNGHNLVTLTVNNHLPNCPCSPSNILIILALHKDFITVGRTY